MPPFSQLFTRHYKWCTSFCYQNCSRFIYCFSYSGINLHDSKAAHPFVNCRLYYSQITEHPEKSIKYIEQNRNKKVVYRSFVRSLYNNIGKGSAFNSLINSGIVHPTAVLVIPFLGAFSGTDAGFGDYQWKSPFDSCQFNKFTSVCRRSKYSTK